MRIKGIRERFEGGDRDFWTGENPGEAREGVNQRENSKEREKGGDLSLESLDFLK